MIPLASYSARLYDHVSSITPSCYNACFPRAPVFAEEMLTAENLEGEVVLPPPERSFWAKYVSTLRVESFSFCF